MAGRRVLVVGSQCAALNELSFLPRAAEDLYAVFTDPVLGGVASVDVVCEFPADVRGVVM